MDLLDENNRIFNRCLSLSSTMFHDQVNSRHVKISEDMQKIDKYFFNNFTKFLKYQKIGPIETYYKYYI